MDHMSSDDIIAELRRQCITLGGVKAWATHHGLLPSLVSDIVNFRRQITPSVFLAMGYRRVVSYEKIDA